MVKELIDEIDLLFAERVDYNAQFNRQRREETNTWFEVNSQYLTSDARPL